MVSWEMAKPSQSELFFFFECWLHFLAAQYSMFHISPFFFFRRHIGTSEKQHMLAEKLNLKGLADTCDFWAAAGFSNYKLFRCCGLDRIYSKLVVSLLSFTDLEALMNAVCTSPDALF